MFPRVCSRLATASKPHNPAVADGHVITGDFTGGIRIFGLVGTT
jgi:hypothetical protein